MIYDLKSRLPTPVRYGLIGVLTMAVYTLVNVLGIQNWRLASGVSAGISMLITGMFNFAAHRTFTFNASRRIGSSLWRYVAVLCLNSLMGGLIVGIATSQLGLSLVFANIVCLAVITLSSYVLLLKIRDVIHPKQQAAC